MARCYICGKPAVKKNLCLSCYANQNPAVRRIRPLSVRRCPRCGALHVRGKWVFEPGPDTLPARIREGIELSGEHEMAGVVIKPLGAAEGSQPGSYSVRVLLKMGRRELEEAYEVPVAFTMQQCPHCAHAGTAYFEGTLQVRGSSPLIEGLIDAEVARAQKKGVRLVRRTARKGGHDYYFSSNKFTTQLAQRLQDEAGGEVKVTRTLHTRSKTGKDLYRITALYRAPAVFRGEHVAVGSRVYAVLSVKGAMKAREIGSGRIVELPRSPRGFRRLAPATTSISKVRPRLEALHPVTFQSVPVKNPKQKKAGEKVRVVFANEHAVYLV